LLIFDHSKAPQRIRGLLTVTGGRATTMRATAERVADAVCARLSVERPCETAETMLLPGAAWYSR
jgi:glycerol-3-phosphate dehydrogenase